MIFYVIFTVSFTLFTLTRKAPPLVLSEEVMDALVK
jgi:hypothetical protein